MKRILFPSDFSANALNAFDYACHFADVWGAEIVILNAFDVPILTTSGKVDVLSTEGEAIRSANTKKAEEFVNSYDQMIKSEDVGNMKISIETRQGPVVEVITEYAKENQVDLIIMGTTGILGHYQSLDDVITCKVIHDTNIPVLAIPEGYSYFPPLKLLYALDFKDVDVEAVNFIEEIAQAYRASLDVLHIDTGKEDQHPDRFVNSRKAFLQLVKYDNWTYNALRSDDVLETILKFADEYASQWIVMKTRPTEWSGLGGDHPSFTEMMCLYSEVPVLALH